MTIRPMLLAGALAAATATAVWSQSQPPTGDAKRGNVLYQKAGCYGCHGTTGAGAGRFGPKLAPDPISFAAYEYELRSPRERMPVYSAKVLPDRDALDIYAYLRSIPAAKSPDDIPLLNLTD